MTTTEATTLFLSILSLVIAAFAAYRTYVLSEYQLRLNTRNEFQKLTLEIQKELIRDPELYAVYDDHPMVLRRQQNPELYYRLEAFAYMVLNVFDTVFCFYGDSKKLTKSENRSFQMWHGLLADFLRKSSIARTILDRSETREVYTESFFLMATSIVRNLSEENE